MTPNEHAHRLHATLTALERAMARHHQALADFAQDCGPELGVDDELTTLAAAPKEPPPNDGG